MGPMKAAVSTVLLAAFLAASAPPVRAQDLATGAPIDCLESSAVLEATRSGRVRPLAEIRRGLDGEVLRADLCREDGGRLFYRMVIFDRLGRVHHLRRDAVTGR